MAGLCTARDSQGGVLWYPMGPCRVWYSLWRDRVGLPWTSYEAQDRWESYSLHGQSMAILNTTGLCNLNNTTSYRPLSTLFTHTSFRYIRLVNHMKWSLQEVGQRPQMLIFRQLSLNCQCGYMKWSHGFILGTDVGQRPQMLKYNLVFRQLHVREGYAYMSMLGTCT